MCNSRTKRRQLRCLTNGPLDSLPDTKPDDSVGGGEFFLCSNQNVHQHQKICLTKASENEHTRAPKGRPRREMEKKAEKLKAEPSKVLCIYFCIQKYSQANFSSAHHSCSNLEQAARIQSM